MEVYTIVPASGVEVPIVISIPHSGTYFPDAVKSRLKPEMAAAPDDTDWFIDRLYDFAPALGITTIKANYSRWVIDLNRDPQQQPLYNDGRVITGLVPLTDFNGTEIYITDAPDISETEQRIEDYFLPYHKKIEQMLAEMLENHGVALLFDAHSIRKFVPGISAIAFPDLILGDYDQMAASARITSAAFESLKDSDFHLEHNHPFKGGFITRSFGKPENNIHALQLEMAKINYMDDLENQYDEERAQKMQLLLKNTFTQLTEALLHA